MSNVRRANRGTSSRDLAEQSTTAYPSDGVGDFTHEHARAQPHFKIGPIRHHGFGKPLALQISECEKRIDFMECELRITDDAKKRARLQHDLGIRMRFLTKLLLEQDPDSGGGVS